MQVWVITGDKQETAINIAISCKLINHPDTLHICNAHSPESAHSRLRELLTAVRQRQNPTVFRAERAAAPSTAELVASAMPLPEGPSTLLLSPDSHVNRYEQERLMLIHAKSALIGFPHVLSCRSDQKCAVWLDKIICHMFMPQTCTDMVIKPANAAAQIANMFSGNMLFFNLFQLSVGK